MLAARAPVGRPLALPADPLGGILKNTPGGFGVTYRKAWPKGINEIGGQLKPSVSGFFRHIRISLFRKFLTR